MLAADPDLQARLRLAAAFDGHPHHRAHPVAIEDLERIRWDDLLFDIAREKALLGIVARDAEHGLGEVVRAEREELRLRRDLVGDDAGARDLDHRPELIVDALPALLEHPLRDFGDLCRETIELPHRPDERHHDLGLRFDALLRRVDRRAEDRADLHLEYLGVYEQEPATAQAEHRVVLVQLLEATEDPRLFFEFCSVSSSRLSHGDLDVDISVFTEELMEGRINQANYNWQPIHRLEHLVEVALLERKQLRERALSPGCVARQDHVLHDRQALGLAEHVLRSRETDALSAKLAGEAAFTRRVGVDPNTEAPALVGPRKQLDELLLLAEVRGDRRELSREDLAGGAVDGDRIALLDDLPADVHLALLKVDIERGDAGNARQTETARHHGGMRGRAAARREDPRRSDHPVEVVRARLRPDQNDELLLSLERHRAVSIEHGASRRGTG